MSPARTDGSGVPPPARSPRFHAIAAIVTGVLVTLLALVFYRVTRVEPKRGYTALGTALGLGASAMFLTALLYSWRKRAGQEWTPGRLQTWLRVHLWVSLAGVAAAVLHAGIHADGGSGTWALIVLGVVVLSGLGGWWLYTMVPGVVESSVGNLALKAVDRRIEDARAEIENLVAGRSDALRAQIADLVAHRTSRVIGGLAPSEKDALAKAEALEREVRALTDRRAKQQRLHGWLRGWLWVHVPAAFLLLPVVLWHVYDAQEWVWEKREVRPADYADPISCKRCHERQYEEWNESAHALAMASPVMELQTRLVDLREKQMLARGEIGTQIVGDLCVRCHAPTGYPPSNPRAAEPIRARARERAPASAAGVSCVTCHQVSRVHPVEPRDVLDARIRDFEQAFPGGVLPDGRTISVQDAIFPRDGVRDPAFGIPYKNIANLSWTKGRRMIGPFGDGTGVGAGSIGNDFHRGEGLAVMREPEFCASCHTVVVDDPNQHGKRIVTLQNTYGEWRDLGTDDVRWGADPGPGRRATIDCMRCHSMDLGPVVRVVEEGLRAGSDIDRLRRDVRAELGALALPESDTRAAEPADGFDLPLPTKRRRYLHTFVGVDRHLGVPEVKRRVPDEKTTDLLRIAAAVRVVSFDAKGTLRVDVHNLATGHNLPAGFAFAREMWIEVALAMTPTAPTDPNSPAWLVVAGGRAGRALDNPEPLDRRPAALARLRSFQAVLFDGHGVADDLDVRPRGSVGAETVLQNETSDVLKGKKARDAGFLDRVGPIGPGGVEKLTIALGVEGEGWKREDVRFVRVRLRFRALPPEFLERLARRFEAFGDDGDGKWRPNGPAAEARSLVGQLRILEMAEDVLPVRAR